MFGCSQGRKVGDGRVWTKSSYEMCNVVQFGGKGTWRIYIQVYLIKKQVGLTGRLSFWVKTLWN